MADSKNPFQALEAQRVKDMKDYATMLLHSDPAYSGWKLEDVLDNIGSVLNYPEEKRREAYASIAKSIGQNPEAVRSRLKTLWNPVKVDDVLKDPKRKAFVHSFLTEDQRATLDISDSDGRKKIQDWINEFTGEKKAEQFSLYPEKTKQFAGQIRSVDPAYAGDPWKSDAAVIENLTGALQRDEPELNKFLTDMSQLPIFTGKKLDEIENILRDKLNLPKTKKKLVEDFNKKAEIFNPVLKTTYEIPTEPIGLEEKEISKLPDVSPSDTITPKIYSPEGSLKPSSPMDTVLRQQLKSYTDQTISEQAKETEELLTRNIQMNVDLNDPLLKAKNRLLQSESTKVVETSPVEELVSLDGKPTGFVGPVPKEGKEFKIVSGANIRHAGYKEGIKSLLGIRDEAIKRQDYTVVNAVEKMLPKDLRIPPNATDIFGAINQVSTGIEDFFAKQDQTPKDILESNIRQFNEELDALKLDTDSGKKLLDSQKKLRKLSQFVESFKTIVKTPEGDQVSYLAPEFRDAEERLRKANEALEEAGRKLGLTKAGDKWIIPSPETDAVIEAEAIVKQEAQRLGIKLVDGKYVSPSQEAHETFSKVLDQYETVFNQYQESLNKKNSVVSKFQSYFKDYEKAYEEYQKAVSKQKPINDAIEQINSLAKESETYQPEDLLDYNTFKKAVYSQDARYKKELPEMVKQAEVEISRLSKKEEELKEKIKDGPFSLEALSSLFLPSNPAFRAGSWIASKLFPDYSEALEAGALTLFDPNELTDPKARETFIVANELAGVREAKRQYNKMLDSPTNADNIFQAIGKQFAIEVGPQMLPFVRDLKELPNNAYYKSVVDKWRNNEPLTEGETEFLRAFARANNFDRANRIEGWNKAATTALSGLMQMAGYMGEFLLTGGLYTGVRTGGAKLLSKTITADVARREGISAIEKQLAKSLSKEAEGALLADIEKGVLQRSLSPAIQRDLFENTLTQIEKEVSEQVGRSVTSEELLSSQIQRLSSLTGKSADEALIRKQIGDRISEESRRLGRDLNPSEIANIQKESLSRLFGRSLAEKEIELKMAKAEAEAMRISGGNLSEAELGAVRKQALQDEIEQLGREKFTKNFELVLAPFAATLQSLINIPAVGTQILQAQTAPVVEKEGELIIPPGWTEPSVLEAVRTAITSRGIEFWTERMGEGLMKPFRSIGELFRNGKLLTPLKESFEKKFGSKWVDSLRSILNKNFDNDTVKYLKSAFAFNGIGGETLEEIVGQIGDNLNNGQAPFDNMDWETLLGIVGSIAPWSLGMGLIGAKGKFNEIRKVRFLSELRDTVGRNWEDIWYDNELKEKFGEEASSYTVKIEGKNAFAVRGDEKIPLNPPPKKKVSTEKTPFGDMGIVNVSDLYGPNVSLLYNFGEDDRYNLPIENGEIVDATAIEDILRGKLEDQVFQELMKNTQDKILEDNEKIINKQFKEIVGEEPEGTVEEKLSRIREALKTEETPIQETKVSERVSKESIDDVSADLDAGIITPQVAMQRIEGIKKEKEQEGKSVEEKIQFEKTRKEATKYDLENQLVDLKTQEQELIDRAFPYSKNPAEDLSIYREGKLKVLDERKAEVDQIVSDLDQNKKTQDFITQTLENWDKPVEAPVKAGPVDVNIGIVSASEVPEGIKAGEEFVYEDTPGYRFVAVAPFSPEDNRSVASLTAKIAIINRYRERDSKNRIDLNDPDINKTLSSLNLTGIQKSNIIKAKKDISNWISAFRKKYEKQLSPEFFNDLYLKLGLLDNGEFDPNGRILISPSAYYLEGKAKGAKATSRAIAHELGHRLFEANAPELANSLAAILEQDPELSNKDFKGSLIYKILGQKYATYLYDQYKGQTGSFDENGNYQRGKLGKEVLGELFADVVAKSVDTYARASRIAKFFPKKLGKKVEASLVFFGQFGRKLDTMSKDPKIAFRAIVDHVLNSGQYDLSGIRGEFFEKAEPKPLAELEEGLYGTQGKEKVGGEEQVREESREVPEQKESNREATERRILQTAEEERSLEEERHAIQEPSTSEEVPRNVEAGRDISESGKGVGLRDQETAGGIQISPESVKGQGGVKEAPKKKPQKVELSVGDVVTYLQGDKEITGKVTRVSQDKKFVFVDNGKRGINVDNIISAPIRGDLISMGVEVSLPDGKKGKVIGIGKQVTLAVEGEAVIYDKPFIRKLLKEQQEVQAVEALKGIVGEEAAREAVKTARKLQKKPRKGAKISEEGKGFVEGVIEKMLAEGQSVQSIRNKYSDMQAPVDIYAHEYLNERFPETKDPIVALEEYNKAQAEEKPFKAYVEEEKKKLSSKRELYNELKSALWSGDSKANKDKIISIIPEFEQLFSIEQSPITHPEGNAGEHTLLVLDAVAPAEDLDVSLSALFHDMGKTNTAGVNPKTGEPTFYDHEKASVDYVKYYRDLIEDMGANYHNVLYLVENHMRYHNLMEMKSGKREKMESHYLFNKMKLLGDADTAVKKVHKEKNAERQNAEILSVSASGQGFSSGEIDSDLSLETLKSARDKIKKLGITDPAEVYYFLRREKFLGDIRSREDLLKKVDEDWEDLKTRSSLETKTTLKDWIKKSFYQTVFKWERLQKLYEEGAFVQYPEVALIVKRGIEQPEKRDRILSEARQERERQQKVLLDSWINYLDKNDNYPKAFSAELYRQVASNIAEKHGDNWKIYERTRDSEKDPLPNLPMAVAAVYDKLKGDDSINLLKAYTEELATESEKTAKAAETQTDYKQTSTDGIWIKYNSQDNDPDNFEKNVADLSLMAEKTRNTPSKGWCTASLASSQLAGGDFYIFATKSEKGLFPRIAIRMEGENIGEMRGIERGQELEPEMLDEARKFLIENNISNVDNFLEAVEIKRFIRDLEDNLKNNEKIDLDEIKRKLKIGFVQSEKGLEFYPLSIDLPDLVGYVIFDLYPRVKQLFNTIEEEEIEAVIELEKNSKNFKGKIIRLLGDFEIEANGNTVLIIVPFHKIELPFESLSDLEESHNLIIQDSFIGDFPKLRNSDFIDILPHAIATFPNLENVNNLIIGREATASFPKLTSIKNEFVLQHKSKFDAPNLSKIERLVIREEAEAQFKNSINNLQMLDIVDRHSRLDFPKGDYKNLRVFITNSECDISGISNIEKLTIKKSKVSINNLDKVNRLEIFGNIERGSLVNIPDLTKLFSLDMGGNSKLYAPIVEHIDFLRSNLWELNIAENPFVLSKIIPKIKSIKTLHLVSGTIILDIPIELETVDIENVNTVRFLAPHLKEIKKIYFGGSLSFNKSSIVSVPNLKIAEEIRLHRLLNKDFNKLEKAEILDIGGMESVSFPSLLEVDKLLINTGKVNAEELKRINFLSLYNSDLKASSVETIDYLEILDGIASDNSRLFAPKLIHLAGLYGDRNKIIAPDLKPFVEIRPELASKREVRNERPREFNHIYNGRPVTFKSPVYRGEDLRPIAEERIGEYGNIILSRPNSSRVTRRNYLPESLRELLKPHQVDAINLSFDRMEAGYSGMVISDGTGSGKTIEALSLAHLFPQIFITRFASMTDIPALIVTNDKRVYKKSFESDAQKMGFTVRFVEREGDYSREDRVKNVIPVTTYNKLVNFRNKRVGLLLLDESHNLKNQTTEQTKAGLSLINRSSHTVALSATPIDKTEHLLYLSHMLGVNADSLLDRLGFEKSRGGWRKKGGELSEKVFARIDGLFDDLTKKGLMLKREIPLDRIDVEVINVPLTSEMVDQYNLAVNDLVGRVENAGMDRRGIEKSAGLLAIRRLLEEFKTASTIDLVESELGKGKQVIVFADRVEDSEVMGTISEGTIRVIEEALTLKGIPYATLYGSKSNATKEIDRFQDVNSPVRVLIATIASGGTGLSLDDVTGDNPRSMIIMTPPFSAMGTIQGIGRINRLNTVGRSSVFFLNTNTLVDQWNYGIAINKMRVLGASVQGEYAALPESFDTMTEDEVVDIMTGVFKDKNLRNFKIAKQDTIPFDVPVRPNGKFLIRKSLKSMREISSEDKEKINNYFKETLSGGQVNVSAIMTSEVGERIMPGIYSATPEEQRKYSEEIWESLEDAEGKNIVLSMFGLELSSDKMGVGWWMGQYEPTIMLNFKDSNTFAPENVDRLEKALSALSWLLRQKAYAYHTAIFSEENPDSLAVSMGRTISLPEMQALDELLRGEITDPDQDFALVASPSGVRILGLREEETGDSNKKFIESTLGALTLWAESLENDIEVLAFKRIGNYIEADWRNNDGQDHILRFSYPRSPLVQRRIFGELRARIEGINERWAKKWGDSEYFAERKREAEELLREGKRIISAALIDPETGAVGLGQSHNEAFRALAVVVPDVLNRVSQFQNIQRTPSGGMFVNGFGEILKRGEGGAPFESWTVRTYDVPRALDLLRTQKKLVSTTEKLPLTEERIVAAAIKDNPNWQNRLSPKDFVEPHDKFYTGGYHWEAWEQSGLGDLRFTHRRVTEGYITNKGRFLSREEAINFGSDINVPLGNQLAEAHNRGEVSLKSVREGKLLKSLRELPKELIFEDSNAKERYTGKPTSIPGRVEHGYSRFGQKQAMALQQIADRAVELWGTSDLGGGGRDLTPASIERETRAKALRKASNYLALSEADLIRILTDHPDHKGLIEAIIASREFIPLVDVEKRFNPDVSKGQLQHEFEYILDGLVTGAYTLFDFEGKYLSFHKEVLGENVRKLLADKLLDKLGEFDQSGNLLDEVMRMKSDFWRGREDMISNEDISYFLAFQTNLFLDSVKVLHPDLKVPALSSIGSGAESNVYKINEKNGISVYKLTSNPIVGTVRFDINGYIDTVANGYNSLEFLFRILESQKLPGMLYTEIVGVTFSNEIILKQPFINTDVVSDYSGFEGRFLRQTPLIKKTSWRGSFDILSETDPPLALRDVRSANLAELNGKIYMLDVLVYELSQEELNHLINSGDYERNRNLEENSRDSQIELPMAVDMNVATEPREELLSPRESDEAFDADPEKAIISKPLYSKRDEIDKDLKWFDHSLNIYYQKAKTGRQIDYLSHEQSLFHNRRRFIYGDWLLGAPYFGSSEGELEAWHRYRREPVQPLARGRQKLVFTQPFKEWFGDWELPACGMYHKESFKQPDDERVFLEKVEREWKGNSVYDLISNFVSNKEFSPADQLIAESILKFGEKGFTVALSDGGVRSLNSGFWGGGKNLYLTKAGLVSGEMDAKNTLLHEYLHGLTVTAYDKDIDFKQSINDIYFKFKNITLPKLYEESEEFRNNETLRNATQNPHEFIAYGLTNPWFRDLLTRSFSMETHFDKYGWKPEFTVWDEILNAISKLFNLAKEALKSFLQSDFEVLYRAVFSETIKEFDEIRPPSTYKQDFLPYTRVSNISKAVDFAGIPQIFIHGPTGAQIYLNVSESIEEMKKRGTVTQGWQDFYPVWDGIEDLAQAMYLGVARFADPKVFDDITARVGEAENEVLFSKRELIQQLSDALRTEDPQRAIRLVFPDYDKSDETKKRAILTAIKQALAKSGYPNLLKLQEASRRGLVINRVSKPSSSTLSLLTQDDLESEETFTIDSFALYNTIKDPDSSSAGKLKFEHATATNLFDRYYALNWVQNRIILDTMAIKYAREHNYIKDVNRFEDLDPEDKKNVRKLIQYGFVFPEQYDARLGERLLHGKSRLALDVMEKEERDPFITKMKKYKIDLWNLHDFAYSIYAPVRNWNMAQINPKYQGQYLGKILKPMLDDDLNLVEEEVDQYDLNNLGGSGRTNQDIIEYLSQFYDSVQILENALGEKKIVKLGNRKTKFGEIKNFVRKRDASGNIIVGGTVIYKAGEFTLNDLKHMEELHSDLLKMLQNNRDLLSTGKAFGDLQINGGLEHPNVIKFWEQENPNYVPLKGFEEYRDETPATELEISEDMEVFLKRKAQEKGFKSSGLSDRQKTLMAGGRESEAGNIIANVFAQYQRSILRTLKLQEVSEPLLNLVRHTPNKDLWRNPNQFKMKRYFDERTGLIKFRINPAEMLGSEALNRGFFIRKDSRIMFIPIEYKPLAIALNGLAQSGKNSFWNTVGMKTFMNLSRNITGVFRNFATALAIEFGLTNFQRDFGTTLVHVMGEMKDKTILRDMIKNLPKTMAGISRVILQEQWMEGFFGRTVIQNLPKTFTEKDTEWSKLFKELRAEGGLTGFINSSSIEEHWKAISTNLGLSNQGFAEKIKNFASMDMAKNFVDKLGDTILAPIMDFNAVMENSWRLAFYAALTKRGMSNKKAAGLAKRLTVDFNQQGNLGPVLKALFLFSNPALMGVARAWQASKFKGVQKILSNLIGFGFALATFNRYIMGQDPEDDQWYWDKIPDWVKSNNIVIPKAIFPEAFRNAFEDVAETLPFISSFEQGGVKAFCVRLPYIYQIFPFLGNALETIGFHKIWGDLENKAAESLGIEARPTTLDGVITKQSMAVVTTIINNFNPLGSGGIVGALAPTVTDIPIALLWNEGWYGGPVYPERYPNDRMPRSAHFSKRTPTWAIAMAEFINEIGGGTKFKSAGPVLDWYPDAINYVAEQTLGGVGKFVSNTYETISSWEEGAPVKPSRVPLLRLFVVGQEQMSSYPIYSDYMERVHDVDFELNKWKKFTDDPQEASEQIQRMIKEYPNEIRLISFMKNSKKRVSDLRKKLKESNDRTEGQKILEQIEAEMRRYIQTYNKIMNK